ncbi:BTAD domain-containing putative transcriptional regulator [Kitasatospora sp. NPDC018058]|uniref:AfsR/SARP family transcriptional regulator n=1 Tax=Kitasatospora sp. NPDC018058 TaxID=3364025 RepID=UPI0037BEE606
MRLGVLGPLEVETDAGDRLVVAAPKQRTLLACLALHANLTVSTGALMEAVWQDRKPVNAKPAILNYVARLRRNLREVADRLQTTAGGYRLEVRDDAELDHLRAATLETRARKAVCDGDWRSGERHADAALALWRGEPLEDVPCERLRADWAPSFDTLQLRLEEVRLDALLSGAHFDRALPRLMDLTVVHPLLEPMYERAMVALYGTGRRAEALSCYGRARRALRDGIGADPSPCLQELHGLALRDAPLSELMAVWDQARALAHSGVRSVARAKAATGLVAPARDGLTDGPQGDLPGGPSAGFPLSQLPRPPQLVVGREQELRELTRLLATPAPLPEAAAAPPVSRTGDGPIATCALDGGRRARRHRGRARRRRQDDPCPGLGAQHRRTVSRRADVPGPERLHRRGQTRRGRRRRRRVARLPGRPRDPSSRHARGPGGALSGPGREQAAAGGLRQRARRDPGPAAAAVRQGLPRTGDQSQVAGRPGGAGRRRGAGAGTAQRGRFASTARAQTRGSADVRAGTGDRGHRGAPSASQRTPRGSRSSRRWPTRGSASRSRRWWFSGPPRPASRTS